MPRLTKEQEQELKDIVFDRLGDMIDPDNIVLQYISLKPALLVLYNPDNIPTNVIEDEWEMAKKGTGFEDVKIYVMEKEEPEIEQGEQ